MALYAGLSATIRGNAVRNSGITYGRSVSMGVKANASYCANKQVDRFSHGLNSEAIIRPGPKMSYCFTVNNAPAGDETPPMSIDIGQSPSAKLGTLMANLV